MAWSAKTISMLVNAPIVSLLDFLHEQLRSY